jgi:hypothetical protein
MKKRAMGISVREKNIFSPCGPRNLRTGMMVPGIAIMIPMINPIIFAVMFDYLSSLKSHA